MSKIETNEWAEIDRTTDRVVTDLLASAMAWAAEYAAGEYAYDPPTAGALLSRLVAAGRFGEGHDRARRHEMMMRAAAEFHALAATLNAGGGGAEDEGDELEGGDDEVADADDVALTRKVLAVIDEAEYLLGTPYDYGRETTLPLLLEMVRASAACDVTCDDRLEERLAKRAAKVASLLRGRQRRANDE